jgi:hypothetical protein
MKKLLLFLGVSLSLISCDPENWRIAAPPGVPGGGCFFCCSGYEANLYSLDTCEGEPNVIEISAEERDRIGVIMSDYQEGECVFISVNPINGSSPKEGYLKAKASYTLVCSV